LENLSQPESIRQRDEALLKDEALIKVYKNLILNGKLTLDPKIPDDDIIKQVIVKATKSITTEELTEIEKTDPEKFKKIEEFISQTSDPKSGDKRPNSFSALRQGKEMASSEVASPPKRLKTEETTEIGGKEDLAPSASPSGQKRERGEEEWSATPLENQAKISKADGGAGRGAGGPGGGPAGGSRG
jgi:hypothetical protein